MLFRWKWKLQWEIVASKGKEPFWVISLIIGGNFDKLRHCRIPIHPPHHQPIREEHFLPGDSGSILPSQPIEMAVRFIERMLNLIEMEVSFKAAKLTALQICVLLPSLLSNYKFYGWSQEQGRAGGWGVGQGILSLLWFLHWWKICTVFSVMEQIDQ